jgi:hypothetical protein
MKSFMIMGDSSAPTPNPNPENDELLNYSHRSIFATNGLEEDKWGLNDIWSNNQQDMLSFSLENEAGIFV